MHDFPLALSVLDELVSLMPIPSSFIAEKREAVVNYLAMLRNESEKIISNQVSLPDSAFRHRYQSDLPHYPTTSMQLRHAELIPFLRGLSPTEPDLSALAKLRHYTAIETNRIEGQLYASAELLSCAW